MPITLENSLVDAFVNECFLWDVTGVQVHIRLPKYVARHEQEINIYILLVLWEERKRGGGGAKGERNQ